ncbi:ABC transporter permease [Desulfitobacterium sp. PCE1]|uniref:ABC transporter permease n=1 Tax=Desulfitobacterium dehalogenans TaxID=36854 RepID=A0A7C6Z4E9_9FIRM|nr:ABC transporter permease [Desulfitobacterium sp. PCE1]HHY26911.1 ABC transporter permease [Desulfitobacterium dehalogenans]
MIKYVIKRIILAVMTIFMVATITFFLMNMVPGGPFVAEKSISAQAQAALNEKFGLDKPLIVQYKNYMLSAAQGDFGLSLKQRGRTVSDIIISKFPVSAKLGGIAVLAALSIGIPLGSIAALNRGKWLDDVIIVIATCGIAFPSFVICTVGMYVFGVYLGVLPTMGLTTPAHYVLPVFALSFYPTAYITRLMRSSMLDVIGQDYMRTARAKGLSQMKSLFKHALRNAILPVITYVGPMLAFTLTGSFIVEKIFVIPGLGGQFVSSIVNRDYTVIMGTTIFLATLVITINALIDILYKFIDPRIQLK